MTHAEGQSVAVEIGGRTITFETGRIARQAHGAVIVRQGETVLLATAVGAKEPRPGADFFPLTVEYRERLAAGGRIPGAYGKREGRIADHEVLASRLADRSVRPLFPEGYTAEVQVFLTVLSADEDVEPESLAVLGASAALALSDIPWEGPIGGVRIARTPYGWQVFPTRGERAVADLDLFVSSGPAGMVMVEGQAREAPESMLVDAMLRADEACRAIAAAIDKLRERAGREKRAFAAAEAPAELAERVAALAAGPLDEACAIREKAARREAIERVREGVLAELAIPAEDGTAVAQAKALVAREVERAVRGRIARGAGRLDGRGLREIRPISGMAGWLPRCHGSAVFTRGETQALVSCTLGRAQDELRIDTLEGERFQRFMLHYNFPPFSTGEIKPVRGPGRREIGHGTLALRALEPVLPDADAFPYAIRVVSDISESNGSSSMATVCGGALALMDAGVPIARPVAGVAMGLIAEDGAHHVLSDILGDEDHLGDMDFKVAGTSEGVTAIQMDNKLGSIPREVLEGALEQAREGRLHVLGEMARILAAPRDRLSPRAPRVSSLRIRPSRIRDLIGPGGRNIQEIRSATGADIDVGDDGLVRIYTKDAAAASEAMRRVRYLTLEPEVGEVYECEVILVRDFFAIVRLGATIEGKLSIGEVEHRRLARIQDALQPGDKITVRVLGVDERGKILVSKKQA